jgi:hypothetical protein
VRALRGRGVIILFHILPFAIVCLNGLDAPVGRSRSSQCLMSKIFEATYHHKLPFNSKDMSGGRDLRGFHINEFDYLGVKVSNENIPH